MIRIFTHHLRTQLGSQNTLSNEGFEEKCVRSKRIFFSLLQLRKYALTSYFLIINRATTHYKIFFTICECECDKIRYSLSKKSRPIFIEYLITRKNGHLRQTAVRSTATLNYSNSGLARKTPLQKPAKKT